MIKKIFILLIIFVQVYLTAFAFSENELSNIERMKYGKMYNDEDLGSRLRRLETDVFGMAQSGDIDMRMNNLSRIVSENNYYQGLYPTEDFSEPVKKSFMRKFFDNVSSSFSSPYVTGYTPPLYVTTGYSNSLSGNDYLNFLNNNNSNYCSYSRPHNYYHGFNRIHRGHRPHNYSPYRNNNFNPYMYNPPTDTIRNVATRSTVHILRD